MMCLVFIMLRFFVLVVSRRRKSCCGSNRFLPPLNLLVWLSSRCSATKQARRAGIPSGTATHGSSLCKNGLVGQSDAKTAGPSRWQLSQEDRVSQPKVARNELPWGNRPRRLQLQRGCGEAGREGCNAVGVGSSVGLIPRVAPSSQLWALRRNPFGIQIGSFRKPARSR